MELHAHEEGMIFHFHRFHDAVIGRSAAEDKPRFFQRFAIIVVEFVSVAVAFADLFFAAVRFRNARTLFQGAYVFAEAHRAADFFAFLFGQDIDDRAALAVGFA